jgi:hypothetical protein
MSDANGKNGSARLLKNPTAEYTPTGPPVLLQAALAGMDGSPPFTWYDVLRMIRDPQVRFSLKMWRSPFQQVTWKVAASSPAVAKFVDATLRKIWRRWLPKLLARYSRYGYCPAGAEFGVKRGAIRLLRLKIVEPRDAQPLVWTDGPDKGRFAGFTVSAPGGSRWVGPEHAIWFAGDGEYGEFYDHPPIAGAFQPWCEKRTRGGSVAVRQVFYRRNAVAPGVMYYPDGQIRMSDGTTRYGQDVARQVGEGVESGGILYFPNTTTGADNQKQWQYTPGQAQPDIAGIREYTKDLDKEISQGIGVPPEVTEASEVGSGYAGRAIPLSAFYGSVDELVGPLIEALDGPVKYAVHANFGRDAWYEITPDSLVEKFQKSLDKSEEPDPGNPGEGAVPPGGSQTGPGQPQPNPDDSPFGIELQAGTSMSTWDEQKHARNHGKFAKKGSGHAGASGSTDFAAVGGAGKGIAEAFYDGIADAIKRTGKVPSAEKNSRIGQAWAMVQQQGLHKLPDAAERFVAATRTANSGDVINGKVIGGGGSPKSWVEALTHHFGQEQAKPQPTPVAQPAPQPKPDPRPNADLDAAFADPTPSASPKSAGPLRHNPDLDDAFGEPTQPKPAAISEKAHAWAASAAHAHAATVARHLRADPAKAKQLLHAAIHEAMTAAATHGHGTAVIQAPDGSGRRIRVTVKRKAKPVAMSDQGGVSEYGFSVSIVASLSLSDYREEDHPRDDHGRFVAKGDIEAAKTDPAKASALRNRVTDPDQRKKLDVQLASPADEPEDHSHHLAAVFKQHGPNVVAPPADVKKYAASLIGGMREQFGDQAPDAAEYMRKVADNLRLHLSDRTPWLKDRPGFILSGERIADEAAGNALDEHRKALTHRKFVDSYFDGDTAEDRASNYLEALDRDDFDAEKLDSDTRDAIADDLAHFGGPADLANHYGELVGQALSDDAAVTIARAAAEKRQVPPQPFDASKRRDYAVVDASNLDPRTAQHIAVLAGMSPRAAVPLGEGRYLVPRDETSQEWIDNEDLANEGLEVQDLSEAEGHESLWESLATPRTVGERDVPASAKDTGTVSGNVAGSTDSADDFDPNAADVYKRVDKNTYMLRRGAGNPDADSFGRYGFVDRSKVPLQVRLPHQYWAKDERRSDDETDSEAIEKTEAEIREKTA